MRVFRLLLACGLGLAMQVPLRAEIFGPVSVVPQTLASGDTHHGYKETRVLLENRSLKDKHEVLLVYPDRSYGYGHSIGRITRRISLAPESRAVVPILQPPLPLNGSGQMRVFIDGQDVGVITMPGHSHMTRSSGHYGGPMIPATVLVSRSVSFDELARALKSDNKAFSPEMAVGRPGGMRSRGVIPTAWSPHPSSSGPHWLEVDFEPPIRADRIRIYDTMGSGYGGHIEMTGISGTNLPPVPLPHIGMAPPGTPREVSFSLTPEPVKTVRIDFGTGYAGSISVDSVELVGSSESGFASAARASSDAGRGSGYPGSAIHEANALLRAELPVSEWTDSWLGYSCFDGIAVSGNEFRTMPPAGQNAMVRFVECGGTLMVFGDTTLPEAWKHRKAQQIESGRIVESGFGRCVIIPDGRVDSLSGSLLQRLNEKLAESGREWQALPDEGAANAAFPVVDNVRIPVRGIVVIMLAFVVAIGPVNIIVLSRMNRRTWLLWTIPAISIVTSFVVFIYSFLREGITPDVRIEGITYLDQQSHRAATVGLAAFYCPLTPGGGLLFSPDTEATPLLGTWNYERGTSREVDWTRGQHLGRGWVSARVPAHFQIRKAETRRERIQIEAAGTDRMVANGLGADIKAIWFCDSEGRIHKAEKVAAGAKARLVQSGEQAGSPQGPTRGLPQNLGMNPSSGFDASSIVSRLQRNCYVAELEGNPFIENGLSKGKSPRIKARSIVYGLLETNPQP